MYRTFTCFVFILIFNTGFSINALANELDISTKLEGFSFSKINEIPLGPFPRVQDCISHTLSPDLFSNELTKSIHNKGWAILSEVRYADYLLVSFSGNLEAATSGICYISQSNIALFKNTKLVGIIYLEESSDTRIGTLQFMDGGFVRLYSGGTIRMAPSADIILTEDGLRLQAIATFTHYCYGESIIPNVYGSSILAGRQMLFDLGFQPKEVEDRFLISWREYLVEKGINEVNWCSGTGLAFCSFVYENDSSHVTLVTAGEDEYPIIVSASVECKP